MWSLLNDGDAPTFPARQRGSTTKQINLLSDNEVDQQAYSMTTKTNSSKLSQQVCGKTIRLSWTDGPTKGTTQEHVFHEDGTVEWHSIETGGKAKPAAESGGVIDEKPAQVAALIERYASAVARAAN